MYLIPTVFLLLPQGEYACYVCLVPYKLWSTHVAHFLGGKLRPSNVTCLRAGLAPGLRCLAPARHKRVNSINPAALGKLHAYDFLASRGLFASSLARPFELYSDIVLQCGGGPSHQQDFRDGVLSDAEGSFDGILKDQSCIDSMFGHSESISQSLRGLL
jgi:hypothetical protein